MYFAVSPEEVNSWFTPFHYFVYLGVILIASIIYYQIKWDKETKQKIKVVVLRTDGDSDVVHIPKEGSSVSIKNPISGATRMWPMNDLCTISMLHPGSAFVPAFLQKKIKTIFVDEQDWEPILNRSPNRMRVASPDVKEALQFFADATTDKDLKTRLENFVKELVTAPTRELIASPALLGNLYHEKVSELAVSVAKDILDPIKSIINKMNKLVSPAMFWIGIGIVVLAVVMAGYFVYSQIIPIQQQLGIIPPA